jgi:serine/threonine protein kinase
MIFLDAIFNNEPVVVKKLLTNVSDVVKVQREVEIQAKFSSHQNICPLRGYFTKNKKSNLVTPKMANGSIRQVIEKSGRLPLSSHISRLWNS